jgi:hypothetical protein
MINPSIDIRLDKMENREKAIAKVLLFSVEQDLIDYLPFNGEEMEIVFNKLILSGLVTRDYDMKGTIKTTVPIYIGPEEVEITQINRTNVLEFVTTHVDELRFLFSEGEKGTIGLRVGAMGDKMALIDKLVKWFKKTGFKYSWEQVIKATKRYIEQCAREDYKYLQAADYFVYKENRSKLSSLIEETTELTNTAWNVRKV